MYRQVLIPDKSRLILQLPDDLIGKKVEVLAFPIEEETKKKISRKYNKDKKMVDLNNTGNTDISDFNFDREEANERHNQQQRLKKLMMFIHKNPVTLPDGYKFDRSELYE